MSRRAILLCSSIVALAVSAASACASFDESPEGQPGDDAATDAAGDGGIDGNAGDGGGEAASTCAPEPIDPFDAGPEDAHCAMGGLEVDLALNAEHCGYCGHACAPSTACTGGACTAESITTYDQPTAIGNAKTATQFYFMSNESGCAASHIRRIELGKTGGEEDVLVEPTMACMSNLFLANGFLYYLHGAYGVRRTPANGAIASEPPILPESSVGMFVVTGTSLLVVDKTYGRISRHDLDGTSGVTIHDDQVNLLTTFGADATSAWWTTEPADAGAGQVDLWGLLPGAVSPVKRASGFTAVRTFALDDEHIYLANRSGEVHRLKKTDASAAERVTSIEAEVRYPRGIAVIGDYVYVAVGGSENGVLGEIAIYRAKKCGGRARLVGRSSMQNNEISAAGNVLYFSAGNSVARFVPTPQ